MPWDITGAPPPERVWLVEKSRIWGTLDNLFSHPERTVAIRMFRTPTINQWLNQIELKRQWHKMNWTRNKLIRADVRTYSLTNYIFINFQPVPQTESNIQPTEDRVIGSSHLSAVLFLIFRGRQKNARSFFPRIVVYLLPSDLNTIFSRFTT